jgi:hypothetical protein
MVSQRPRRQHGQNACSRVVRGRDVTGTADVIGASVAIVARKHQDVIVTSDPEDILRLDPGASVVGI